MAKGKPVVRPRLPPPMPPPLSPEARAFIEGDAPGRPADVSETSGRRLADASETSGAAMKPRAAYGTAAVSARRRGPARRRTTVYFMESTWRALEEHCARTGDEVSELVDEAVREGLARRR